MSEVVVEVTPPAEPAPPAESETSSEEIRTAERLTRLELLLSGISERMEALTTRLETISWQSDAAQETAQEAADDARDAREAAETAAVAAVEAAVVETEETETEEAALSPPDASESSAVETTRRKAVRANVW